MFREHPSLPVRLCFLTLHRISPPVLGCCSTLLSSHSCILFLRTFCLYQVDDHCSSQEIQPVLTASPRLFLSLAWCTRVLCTLVGQAEQTSFNTLMMATSNNNSFKSTEAIIMHILPSLATNVQQDTMSTYVPGPQTHSRKAEACSDLTLHQCLLFCLLTLFLFPQNKI